MDSQFKELDPNKTIKNIKKYFKELDIEAILQFSNERRVTSSTQLKVVGTDLFSNGKGVNDLYAIASAYAELTERINNYCFARFSTTILNDKPYSDTRIKINHFSYRDKGKSYDDILTWLKLLSGNIEENIKPIAQILLDYCLEFNMESIPSIKLTSDNGEIYLPVTLLNYFYGTNGMCAGNTLSEALVQGFSEIIERNIIDNIFNDKLKPIECTNKISSQYPHIGNYIYEIEKQTKGKVFIKGFSYVYDIPVYSLLFVNKDSRVFIKLGAHPIERIAIERCFTEFLQGKNLESISGLSYISDFYKANDFNKYQIFLDGSGIFPLNYFEENKIKYDENNMKSYHSNKESLDEIKKSFVKHKLSCYYFDTSNNYLNTVHIIIPGFSEMVFPTKKVASKLLMIAKLKKALIVLNEVSIRELKTTVKVIEENYTNETTLDFIFHDACIIMRRYLGLITVYDIKIAIYYKLGQFDLVLQLVEEKFALLTNENKIDDKLYSYYQLLIIYLNSIIESDKEIYNTFKPLFDIEVIELVEEDINNSFSNFLKLNYCNICKYRNTNNCVDIKKHNIASNINKRYQGVNYNE